MGDFYLTQMGHKFFGADVPKIAKSLEKLSGQESSLSSIANSLDTICKELQRANDLKEKELMIFTKIKKEENDEKV